MIIPIDCHSHSIYSPDGKYSVELMCKEAEKLNLKVFAITDHCDVNLYTEEVLKNRMGKSYADTYKCKETMKSKTKILTGIEINGYLENVSVAKNMLDFKKYDVVLGSVHNGVGCRAYSHLEFDKTKIDELLSEYFYLLNKTSQISEINVIAHCTYPLRYIEGDLGIPVNMDNYKDELDEVYKTIIYNGKALEVNSAGLKKKIKEPSPNFKCLQRYKELGGELLTLGSDAHSIKDIAYGFDYCTEMIKEAGFKYITYFENRKPFFYKI